VVPSNAVRIILLFLVRVHIIPCTYAFFLVVVFDVMVVDVMVVDV